MKQKFNEAVQEYILAFCIKHDIDFDYWIGGDIGGIAVFRDGNVYLNFDDIRFDIDTNQPAGLIIKHNWDTLFYSPKKINFKSYTEGLRYDQV